MTPIEKKYTRTSLEVWFKAYRKWWWDKYFLPVDVQLAEQVLNQGVRTITVEDQLLMVTGQWGNQPYVSTLELNSEGALVLNFSTKNPGVGKAFAAAGLISLERLIEENLTYLCRCDELPLTSAGDRLGPLDNGAKKIKKGQLKFFKNGQNLAFEVFFYHASGPRQISSQSRGLTLEERECLLNLSCVTQKYGFHWTETFFQSSKKERFCDFIGIELPRLSRKYDLEMPDNIQQLSAGVKLIESALDIDDNSALQQTYWVGSTPLPADELQQFSPAKHHIYWSDKYGLLQWAEEEIDWTRRLNQLRKHCQQLPPYLLISLFNNFKVRENALAWLDNLKAKLPLSCHLTVPLRPYQLAGVKCLKHLLDMKCHPLIADEMGLGKTRQILSTIQWINTEASCKQPTLIICPASVISSWQNEQNQYFPYLKLQVLSRQTLSILTQDTSDLFVISYSQLRTCVNKLKMISFQFVVLDEAQYIKNPHSKTTLACFKLSSRFRIAATGTPLENSLNDVWSIFNFLMPGLLGSYRDFQTFLQREDACQRLKIQLAPFVLRRTKHEVLNELPKKTEQNVYCQMTEWQRQLYDTYRNGYKQIKHGNWGALFVLFLRLRQICCDPSLLPDFRNENADMGAKLLWLREQLGVCERNKQKIIIFSQFRRLLERILPLVSVFYPGKTFILTGNTAVDQRRELIKNFQEAQEAAFLISLKAGGTGITLHSASTVFLMDPWWNPSIEQQAIARVHRLGQQHPLQVYRLLIKGSIEDKIQKLQKQKGEIFSHLFEKDNQLSPADRWQLLYDLIDQK